MGDELVPKENIEIYCYLYRIETALREFIIDLLENLEGPRWYKKRLPGDILEKYRKAREIEKSIKWTQLIPHHPVYYIDFPDLKKIIERSDNWKDAFKKVFSRKDILSSTLSELEFIRNSIAHNRKSTQTDVTIVKATYGKLSQAIGKERFDELSARCTHSTDIWKNLQELLKESQTTYSACKNCEPLENLVVWGSTHKEWWFDESYLGHKLDEITNYFKLIEEYVALPRTRGIGHKIEEWVRRSDIDEKYNESQVEFVAILSGEIET